MAFAALTLTVAACGGGSGGGTTPYTPPSTAPSPNGTTSTPVSASSGGSVSTTMTNGGSVSVTVPANALSTSATVTVYSYASASNLPKSPFAKTATNARHRSAVPSGATFLAGFAIDTGTAVVMTPLKVTETIPSVPTGDVVHVARFNGTEWDDVDTATASGTTATNDLNKKYVSISGGGTSNPYIFYAVASSAAPAPAAITATATSKSSLVIGGNADFTVSAADANGNPLPFTPGAFDTDNHALATAKAGSTPFDVVLTAANQGGTVNVVVVDSRTGTYHAPVTILTQRPSNAGDTFTFSGTLTQTDVYAYPTPSPIPGDSKTANVTQTVTVSATSNPFGSGTVQDFNVAEKDAFPTQTLSSTTDSYFQEGAANGGISPFYLLGSSSTDDQGNTSQTQFASPGVVVDELPEASGQSWTNSPAAAIKNNYVGLESVTRTVNADGSYAANENIYSAPIPSPAPGTPSQNYPNSSVSASGYADGHGDLSFQFTIPNSTGAPAGTAFEVDMAVTAPNNNAIDFMRDGRWYPSMQTPPPFSDTQAVPQWYTIGKSGLYSESDVNLGSVAIPSSCNVPKSFGKSANQIQQKTSTIDPMMGTLETVQTDEYVVTGFGPVCVSISDVDNQYYNYQGDQAYSGNFSGFPVLSSMPLVVTTVAETLAIQNASVSAQSRQAMTARAAIPSAAIALARQHVQALTHRAVAAHHVAATHAMMSAIAKGAQRK